MTKTTTQIAHEAGKFPYGEYHLTCDHCNPKTKTATSKCIVNEIAASKARWNDPEEQAERDNEAAYERIN